jgi:hypothetical protein
MSILIVMNYFQYCSESLNTVHQESVLGPPFFFLCDVMNHSNCILSAKDLEISQAIKELSDCLFLQSDFDCMHDWCLANFTKLNFGKIRVIFLTQKRT